MRRLIAGLTGSFLFFATTVLAQTKPSWQLEWEKTVDGAKKEGKLSLYLYQGDGELAAVADAFHKKYPEIAITTVTGRGSQLGPRIMAERRAEKYLVDVYIGGPTTPYTVFYRAQVLEPIKPALILPEVLDESKWWQGKHHYIDPEGKHIFVFVGNASGGYVAYNSKLADAGKFNSYWDFLDAKWKGKILSMDPSESGRQRIGVRILYYRVPLKTQ
jgi:ABC-type Fe3+ transport system substrate-binding protein